MKRISPAPEISYSHYFEAPKPEILSAVPLKEWLTYYLVDINQGFGKERLSFRLLRAIILPLLKMYENLIGAPLFMKADQWDFLKIELRFKKIIQDLKDQDVISSVSRGMFLSNSPAILFYSTRINQISKPDGKHIVLSGSLGGGGPDSNTAVAATLAETLERHALCMWEHNHIINGSFRSLRYKGAINPLKFKSFSDKQLKNPETKRGHYFDEDTPFSWIAARCLMTGKKCLVPTQLAYIRYSNHKKEQEIHNTTTSGAGGGDSWERAAYSAICENIERDAFMIFWLNKIVPPRIDATKVENKHIQKILRHYRHMSIEVIILNITTDIQLPVFSVITIDRTQKSPAICIGASADLNPEKAVLHALLENIKGRSSIMPFMTEENFLHANIAYPMFKSAKHRCIWWAQPKTIEKIEWFLRGKKISLPQEKSLPPQTYKEKLESLKHLLQKAGHKEVYLIDATSPLAQKYGLSVVMSLIPGFYPLYLNERYKYLGVERLYTLPVKLGYLDYPKKEEEINIIPHPFP